MQTWITTGSPNLSSGDCSSMAGTISRKKFFTSCFLKSFGWPQLELELELALWLWLWPDFSKNSMTCSQHLLCEYKRHIIHLKSDPVAIGTDDDDEPYSSSLQRLAQMKHWSSLNILFEGSNQCKTKSDRSLSYEPQVPRLLRFCKTHLNSITNINQLDSQFYSYFWVSC